MGKAIYNGYWKKKKKTQLTAHLQNRGFSARLRDSGFVLHLGSQIHFGQNSPASQMRKTLWTIPSCTKLKIFYLYSHEPGRVKY
jgi:hypothetical protein